MELNRQKSIIFFFGKKVMKIFRFIGQFDKNYPDYEIYQ